MHGSSRARMHAVAIIALVSSSLALYAAVLAGRMSLAPGSRDARWFAVAAVAGGAYSLCTPLILVADAPGATVLFSRVQFAAAAVHFAAWLRYTEAFLALRGGRALRLAANGLGAAGLLGLVPGLALSGTVLSHEFRPWGAVYREALHTPYGDVVVAGIAFASLVALWHLVRAALSRVAHAPLLAAAYATLLALGANDALASTGRLESPLLLDVGFAAPIVAVAWMMTARFVDSARALERLRGELLQDVESRTKELATALDALHQAEKLAALGEFASGVAHEVNNPASVVTANLRYLSDAAAHGTFPPDGAEALDDALASMKRINDLVRKLVDAGRIAAVPSGSATVLVAEAVAGPAAAARARGQGRLAVEIDVPMGTCVRARREPLEEVLGTLLENAVEAIPEDRPGHIRIRAERAGDRVRVTVRDDGVGMSPEVLRRALDPFFTTKPPGRGAGLGLAVARALVEGQGGSLWLESAPGEGTTAFVELPDVDGSPPPHG